MIILSFAQKQVAAFQVEVERETPRIKTSLERGDEELADFLKKVKQTFDREKEFRLLLPEEEAQLYYWSTLSTQVDRELVLKLAKKKDVLLEDHYFSFKEAVTIDNKVYFQLLKTNRSSLQPFLQQLALAGLQPQVIETPAFALARLKRFEKEPLLLICRLNQKEDLLLAVFAGRVLAKSVVKKSDRSLKIKEFKQEVKTNWQLDLKENLKPLSVLDSVKGLALRGPLEEKGNFLNLKMPPLEETDAKETTSVSPLPRPRMSFLTLAGLTLASTALVALIGGGIVVYQKALQKLETTTKTATNKQLPLASTNTEVTPTVIVTDSDGLRREEVRLKILNGAGVAGTAGQAKDFLADLGYKQIETGNADNFTYQQTEIFVSSDNEELFELLKNDLSSVYSVDEEMKQLEEDEIESLDGLIIVGKLTVEKE